MSLLLALVLTADPVACLPTPSEVKKYGDEVATAYQEGMAKDDPKAPALTAAPADARLLLRKLWTLAGKKTGLTALRPLMDPQFTWSFGGDADADQALGEWAKDPKLLTKLRTALTGACKPQKDSLTCAGKSGPRAVFEKRDGCWRWTSFVEGD